MPWIRDVLLALFSSTLYDLLLATGVGVLIGALKAKKEQWAGPVIYGLTAFALVLVIGFSLTGQSPLSARRPETNAENVEENIRAWADHLGVGITRQDPPSDTDFLYLLALRSGRSIYVGRKKNREGYLMFQASVTVAKEHEDLIAKLSPKQQTFFNEELLLELARSRIGYSFAGPRVSSVIISKAVPITGDLSEAGLAGYLDETESAISLCQEAIPLAIEHATFLR